MMRAWIKILIAISIFLLAANIVISDILFNFRASLLVAIGIFTTICVFYCFSYLDSIDDEQEETDDDKQEDI